MQKQEADNNKLSEIYCLCKNFNIFVCNRVCNADLGPQFLCPHHVFQPYQDTNSQKNNGKSI